MRVGVTDISKHIISSVAQAKISLSVSNIVHIQISVWHFRKKLQLHCQRHCSFSEQPANSRNQLYYYLGLDDGQIETVRKSTSTTYFIISLTWISFSQKYPSRNWCNNIDMVLWGKIYHKYNFPPLLNHNKARTNNWDKLYLHWFVKWGLVTLVYSNANLALNSPPMATRLSRQRSGRQITKFNLSQSKPFSLV